LATATMAPASPLDSSSSSYATELSLAGTWIEKADTPKAGGYGEAVVGTDNGIYITRCYNINNNPSFWRYDTLNDIWDIMNVSGLTKGAFRNGAALAWDSEDYIYALLGGSYSDTNRTLFYRYSISNNRWEKLIDTPHTQGAGDALTWFDNKIYAFLGSKEHGTAFGCYNLSNNSWYALPLNPNWTTTDDGASLVWTGGEYLYALRGEWQETVPSQDYARYHIPTRTWAGMEDIPESEGVGDGGSLLWVNDYSDYIYALGGNSCLEVPGYNFYRYSISSDSWESLESIPCPVGNYVGNRLGFAGGHIYYWQGSPKTEKWVCGGDAFYMFEFQELSFDTGTPLKPYPSIAGIHNGTLKLNQTIEVSKLYTYPCAGTGGHTEYAKIYNESWSIETSLWEGYTGDWHNISFTDSFKLSANVEYRYTIRTGSYPQIIHADSKAAAGGTITCTSFVDASGNEYDAWIPAIRFGV
ncbi:MAG: hypothetical protein KAT65_08570, partial [Methanophagales archaeon]|nr:hypothetical protein [Methanophagales archaeon]